MWSSAFPLSCVIVAVAVAGANGARADALMVDAGWLKNAAPQTARPSWLEEPEPLFTAALPAAQSQWFAPLCPVATCRYALPSPRLARLAAQYGAGGPTNARVSCLTLKGTARPLRLSDLKAGAGMAATLDATRLKGWAAARGF